MAVSNVQGAPPGGERLKSIAAPVAAAALGVTIAIVGGTVLTSNEAKAPEALLEPPLTSTPEAPTAMAPEAAPPEPGGALPGVAFDPRAEHQRALFAAEPDLPDRHRRPLRRRHRRADRHAG